MGLVNERSDDADRVAMREVRRIARAEVSILITLPLAKEYSVGEHERNYNTISLECRIIRGFTTKCVQVLTRMEDGYWFLSQVTEELADVDTVEVFQT